MRYLAFTLYAPMASFGEVAVGARRTSWTRPGRSGVLGLLAGALGIDRHDDEGHADLDQSLYFAVRTDAVGTPLTDYHVAQTPGNRAGQTYATRREELAAGDLNTILSTREWRTDGFYTAVLWPRPGMAPDMDGYLAALERPYYSLYLGRRAGPFGLPLHPELLDADSLLEALAQRTPTPVEDRVLMRLQTDSTPEIACDHDVPGLPEARVERRRDSVVSRSRWQFRDRLEATFRQPAA